MKTSTLIAGSSLTLSLALLMLALAASAGAFGGKGDGFGMSEEDRAQMQAFHDSITQDVENIENGVLMTLTSDDPETVTLLQAKEPKEPRNENVTHTQENIENGIKITITSDDPTLVEQIQSNPQRLGGGFGERGFGRHGGCDMQPLMGNVDHEATNIENGVVITITSDDPEAVTRLQAKEPKESRNENVTHTQENIENGIKITITSDDPTLVEQIQSNPQRLGGGFGERGGHRGRMRGGSGMWH